MKLWVVWAGPPLEQPGSAEKEPPELAVDLVVVQGVEWMGKISSSVLPPWRISGLETEGVWMVDISQQWPRS